MQLLPGDPSSPVLLHVPHSGTRVPERVRERLLLSDAELAAEIAALTDHGTDVVALRAAGLATVRPFAIVNPMSRFVVDPERFPDDREEMAAAGMGAVYTHGTRGQRIRADDPAHPRPGVCLGTDTFHTPKWLVDAARAALGPLGEVALDTPFAGTYVPLAHFRADPRVASLMLELRRDVVSHQVPALARALAALMDAVQR